MEVFDWSKIEKEPLSEGLARKAIHIERMTAAQIFLDKGAKVAAHSHDNEQMTVLLEGRLLFTVDGVAQELLPGQALHLPSNCHHGVEALEDSLALDLFIPRREDWIRGDDAYLRG
jgi:quercetin dioxygenase-like cupin family protein